MSSNGTDASALLEALHPEIVVHQAASLPFGGDWTGHDGFRRWLNAFTDCWDQLEVIDPEVHELGEGRLVSTVTMSARSRRTGRTLLAPLCQLLRFEEGLLIEVRPFYWDTAEVNRVLGHVPC